MKPLDFLVIGAQKCATTTLFELLRQHPALQLPLEKEVPFFTGPTCSRRDWDRFAARYLPGDGAQKVGKVTPQYMGDAQVPARLAALAPHCRLIAVLRDPLERSHSHYRMAQRRGTESRDFAEAMAPLLEPRRQRQARCAVPPTHAAGYEPECDFYLAWSEYGRILAGFRQFFPARQLLVIYSEDLQANPRAVLERVLAFIGVSSDFDPQGLGEVMHAGGSGNRTPHGLRVWLRERRPVAALWRRVPAQQQGRLRFLYERWNARSSRQAIALPAALEEALTQHFAADLKTLLALGIPEPPWLRRYVGTGIAPAPGRAA